MVISHYIMDSVKIHVPMHTGVIMVFVNHAILLVLHVHLVIITHVNHVKTIKLSIKENVFQHVQMEHMLRIMNVRTAIHYVKLVMDILILTVYHVTHHTSILKIHVYHLVHSEPTQIQVLTVVLTVITTVIPVPDQMLVIVIHVKMDFISMKASVFLHVMMDITRMKMIMNVLFVRPLVKHVVVEHQLIVSHVSFQMTSIYMEHHV